ncbi:hypothetical protein D3C76_1619180 [compost metagenome]
MVKNDQIPVVSQLINQLLRGLFSFPWYRYRKLLQMCIAFLACFYRWIVQYAKMIARVLVRDMV